MEKCPICGVYHPRLIKKFNTEYEGDIIETIKLEELEWDIQQGICSRCFDQFETITYLPYRMEAQDSARFELPFSDYYIYPIAERINADADYSGKGVNIAFIDSGYYLHPDIQERVKKVLNIETGDSRTESFLQPKDIAWHGMMTTAVCAGSGRLSKGLYKGIAHEAHLYLIAAADSQGKIPDAHIIKALEWVLAHHKEYNIRILNLSLSGDKEEKLSESRINALAERLFEENVLVVAAVGNNEHAQVLPPASGPHVVAVGGLDDDNKLEGDISLYHSSYGVTVDGNYKPELISPAIWIPAPILPGTPSAKKAELLFHVLENNGSVAAILENNAELFEDEADLKGATGKVLLEKVLAIIKRERWITPQYLHADGTSFAAPIVCSVAAQMLEANPTLSSRDLREILLATSMPLPHYDIIRQGYGKLQPKAALYAVSKRKPFHFSGDSPFINYTEKSILFSVHLPQARRSVSLVGSFNKWKPNEVLLKPAQNDYWYVQLPLFPSGTYTYKFLVDNQHWIGDAGNPHRVSDGANGWNSVMEIN